MQQYTECRNYERYKVKKLCFICSTVFLAFSPKTSTASLYPSRYPMESHLRDALTLDDKWTDQVFFIAHFQKAKNQVRLDLN